MISQRLHTLKALVLRTALSSLAACASGARPGAMTTTLDAGHILSATSPLCMAVAVSDLRGGRDPNPLLASQVSSSDFKTAFQQSLQINTMLATGAPKYNLRATL